MIERYPSDQAIEELLTGVSVDASLDGVAEFFTELQGLSEAPMDKTVAARHVAMIAGQTIVSPVRNATTVAAESQLNRWRLTAFNRRRRIMFNSLTSSLVAKILAGSVALAAVAGTGMAVANAAVPGSPLYGIDRAIEKIGIGNGGSAERTSEALAVLESGDVPGAAHTAGQAIGAIAHESGDARAQDALQNAADQIETVRTDAAGYTKTQALRDQVALLLGAVSDRDHDGIIAASKGFADIAKGIAATHVPDTTPPNQANVPTSLPASSHGGTPPVNTPPVSTPPVSTPPVSHPPVSHPPVSHPPVSHPPVSHP